MEIRNPSGWNYTLTFIKAVSLFDVYFSRFAPNLTSTSTAATSP